MFGRLLAAIVFCVGVTAIPAGANQKIELQDGTVILGEILSFDGSTYTLRTESLGQVKIEKSKVRSIQMGGSATEALQGVQQLRDRIMADPESLRMIMALQDDPDVQAVLNDPEVMSAADAGDLDRLLSHPKVIKLLQNPVIQDIGKGLLNSPGK
jgi:hypothetical protein